MVILSHFPTISLPLWKMFRYFPSPGLLMIPYPPPPPLFAISPVVPRLPPFFRIRNPDLVSWWVRWRSLRMPVGRTAMICTACELHPHRTSLVSVLPQGMRP